MAANPLNPVRPGIFSFSETTNFIKPLYDYLGTDKELERDLQTIKCKIYLTIDKRELNNVTYLNQFADLPVEGIDVNLPEEEVDLETPHITYNPFATYTSNQFTDGFINSNSYNDMVRKWRQSAMLPEIDEAITEISSEAIVFDEIDEAIYPHVVSIFGYNPDEEDMTTDMRQDEIFEGTYEALQQITIRPEIYGEHSDMNPRFNHSTPEHGC